MSFVYHPALLLDEFQSHVGAHYILILVAHTGTFFSKVTWPARGSAFVAYNLPFYEAIAGLRLLLGWRRRVPGPAVLLMSAVFALATAQSFARNLYIACGCFGGDVRCSGQLWMALALDSLLLLGSWIVKSRSVLGAIHDCSQERLIPKNLRQRLN